MFRRTFLQKTALTLAGASTISSLISATAINNLTSLPASIQKHLQTWQNQMNPKGENSFQTIIQSYTNPDQILNHYTSDTGYAFTYLNQFGTKIELSMEEGELKTVTSIA